MGRPKGSKNNVKNTKKEVKTVQPEQNVENVAVTQAVKAYIFEHYGKMSVQELAKNTHLSEEEVEKLAVSKELDVQPVVDGEGPKKLRRFDTYKGAVSMTQGQSMLGDIATQKHQSEQAGPLMEGVEKIKVNN